jgi:hypothetical protein
MSVHVGSQVDEAIEQRLYITLIYQHYSVARLGRLGRLGGSRIVMLSGAQ